VIPLAPLPDRVYAVLGLGSSGMAACRALIAAGKTVWAWDDAAAIREKADAAGIPLVDLGRADPAAADVLVLSPGIPHTWPRPHPVAERARAAGCPIVGDCELLARAVPDAIFVGITGTNGKSTTTALIGHILRVAGRSCAVGANLGRPALDLEPLDPRGAYVLEMSSYQLELTPSLVFNVSILLNISADHLDRHGGMDGYIAAKRAIFRGQGPAATAVVGADDVECRRIGRTLARAGGPRTIPISGVEALAGGVFGCDGILYDDTRGGRERVLDLADAAALPGPHNAQNAAAAYAAALALGVAPAVVRDAIVSFPGLDHRQQRVAEIDGVLYVNDSKATNADAAARALACYPTIYWIAGGRPKEGGLAALYPHLPRVRHAFLIGEAEARFAEELEGRVAFSRVGTLDRAVTAATVAARTERLAGAVVLLSPACASFDQFSNFEARGAAFRSLVEALAR
jgi:UDP-N-acetylmuramoylalanine--D-glutamate ligase